MGFRTKDEVIYSRVTGSIRGEFHKQMEESGYKSSSDFIEYLLRVNRGKQVDGVTLKEFMDVMKEVAHELKKQGVNINQIARYINSYLGFATEEAFWDMEKSYKNMEGRIKTKKGIGYYLDR